MNAEEASLLWNRKDEVDQIGGSAAHRQLALKHLKLKTVIKVCVRSILHADLRACRSECKRLLFVGVPSDQDAVGT